MYIFATIMSSLALLAALAGIALLVYEKKCSKKRNTALMQYVDAEVKVAVTDAMNRYEKRVADLEGGIIPDFEKAKAAADAVNNFNAGISGILGFDPHEVLKKQRAEGGD
jgi:hypothetical protein